MFETVSIMEKQQPGSYAKNTVVKNNRNNYTEAARRRAVSSNTPVLPHDPTLPYCTNAYKVTWLAPANEQHTVELKSPSVTLWLLFPGAPEGFYLKLQP